MSPSPTSAPRAILFGHPVRHSLSPKIMATLSKQTGAALNYSLAETSPDQLPGALEDIADDHDVIGLNFTLPHKTSAATLAKQKTAEVEAIGSSNMWARADRGFCAYNTDGPGFLGALAHRGVSVENREIIVLGAGGAARGVAYACLTAGAQRVYVWNRTASRAKDLCSISPEQIFALQAAEELAQPSRAKRIVINATSLGLKREDALALSSLAEPLLPFLQGAVATDLIYSSGQEPTPFLLLARDNNLMTIDCALAMLALQAVRAFNLWMGTQIGDREALTLLEPTLKP